MRGGLMAPMALAAGLILCLLPSSQPPGATRQPASPQARPAPIVPSHSLYSEAAYDRHVQAAKAPGAASEGGGSAGKSGMAGLDVLFVGAHPDDESGDLSTFGQWNEQRHLRTGVLAITRGEGGGNAVGTEEGPALGLLREAEERTAVALAGIHDIDYLDKVDFYYTVSDQLTRSVWDHDST